MAQGLSHRLGALALRYWGMSRTLQHNLHEGEVLRRRGYGGAKKFPEAAMLNHTLVSIVDDNQPFRESLRKLVMLFGYTVESFPSAADFLASRPVPETDSLDSA